MPHFGPGNVGHQPPPGGGGFLNNQNFQPFIPGGGSSLNPNFNPVPGPDPGKLATGSSFINPGSFSPGIGPFAPSAPAGATAGAAALQSVGGNEGAGGRTVGSQQGILNTFFPQAGAAGGAAGPGVTPGGPVPTTPRSPGQLGTGPNAQQISSGGQLFGPGDVDFFVANGMISPQQADILRQVASRDLAVSQTLTSQAGFNKPAGTVPIGSQSAPPVNPVSSAIADPQGFKGGGLPPKGTSLEVIAQQQGLQPPVGSPQQGGFQGPSGAPQGGSRIPFGQPLPGEGQPFGGGGAPAGGFGGQVPPGIDPLFGNVFGSVPGGLPTADPFTIGSDAAKADRAARQQDINRLGGFAANDLFGLPGSEAGIPFGLLMNMLFGQIGPQEQRLDQAGNLISNARTNLAQGPAVGIATGVGTELQRNPFTTSSPQLQQEVEQATRRQFAQAQQGALSGLSDRTASAGLRGGESDLLRAGTQFGGQAALSGALTQNRLQFAQNRANDIAAALGGGQAVGDIFTNQLLAPSALEAQFLSQQRPQNPFFDAAIEALSLATGANIQQAIGSASNPLSTPGGIIGSFAQNVSNFLPLLL